MELIILTLTVVGVVIAGFSGWFTYLGYIVAANGKKSLGLPAAATQSSKTLCDRYLAYFWKYPTEGPNEASWAVKESFVLRGNLKNAREKPGLGTAIISTELALDVFGEAAQSRISGTISWALAHAFNEPPRFMKAEILDSTTSTITVRPDFRHSLAFAIVLARSGQMPAQLEQYLSLVFKMQNDQGGWPPGEGVTIAELFTVTYAFELLALCANVPHFTEDVRRECAERKDRAATWLATNVKSNGLWDSGILKDCVWDELVSTAWVIHRVVRFDTQALAWGDCLRRASLVMVEKAVSSEAWHGTTEIQRFRAESRVGAAAAAILGSKVLDENTAQLLNVYLRAWRERALRFGTTLPEIEWDLSTVLFCLDGLITRSEMRAMSKRQGIL